MPATAASCRPPQYRAARCGSTPDANAFVVGNSVMAGRIRALDWDATALGPLADWPQPLRTLVTVMLSAGQPMFVAWGANRTLIYNDAYAPLLTARHPHALGRPFFAVWPEVREALAPLFERVFAGHPVHMDDITLMLDRGGERQEAHFSFSYTPVFDQDGAVLGLFCPCSETTHQVLAERRRAEERERFARLFDQAPSFMAMLQGPEHRIELANPGYLSLVGDRPLVGLTFAEALPDAVAQGYLAWLDEVYRSGRAYTATGARYAVQASMGGPVVERFVDLVYQPITDAAGKITGIFVEGVDVTTRTHADVALREQQTRNQQILDSAIDYAIVATDLEGRITRWNEGARRVLGWTEAEMLGQSVSGFFTSEDVAAGQPQKEMRAALDTGRGLDERWHRRRNGERFWAFGEMTPLTEADGAVTGFVKVLRDRTEQRLAEEAARRSQARLAAALDIARLGTFEWDVATDVVDMNPRSREIFGFPPGQGVVTAADVFARIAAVDLDRVTERTRQAVAAGVPLDITYEIALPDGTARVVHGVGNFMGGDPGETSRMFGVFSDVTDRKRAETALLESNGTLERRISAALAERETVEDALRQSQKMEAVGQLTGGLAHDFNNLLAGISGSLELLQARIAQGRTGEVDRYVAAAQDAARRAAALTHRLLAFSRRQTLAPRPTDINRLVAGLHELIERTTGPSIAVELVADPDLWTTLVDPSQLENALLNLCINARDAMPDGGRLTIRTANRRLDPRAAHELELSPGPYVSLCVSDDGSGMPPDVAARAFDPFFTTKPIGMGTGLGLSMIYGFARQSGGQARIETEVGRGTTVCIHLPRHAGIAEPGEIELSPAAAPRAGRDETVLVVDDEPTVRMLVTETLEDLGYTAIEAADGAAGLRALESASRIDLLVTDVGLPGGMNGRQVADAARIARPGLKVLFITGYAENAVLSDGHLEPGMHVLTKPFAMDALARRIKELIDEP